MDDEVEERTLFDGNFRDNLHHTAVRDVLSHIDPGSGEEGDMTMDVSLVSSGHHELMSIVCLAPHTTGTDEDDVIVFNDSPLYHR